MQQIVYLVRHAQASAPGEDGHRHLSAKGENQLTRLSEGLAGKELVTPQRIWHSSLVRARETAHLLREGLALDAPLSTKDNLGPEDDPSTLIDAIGSYPGSTMIVGHEPNLSILSSRLLAGTDTFEQIVFPTASILCLSRFALENRSTPWLIEWHISHRLFK